MVSRSATHEQLAECLASFAQAHAKLAIRRVENGWELDHAHVAVNEPRRSGLERHWRYATHHFLELSLPGQLLADLLMGKPQQVDDLIVAPPKMASNALRERLPSHRPWQRVTVPWPFTEWTVSRESNQESAQPDLLIGDGPVFLNADAAFTAFMYGAQPTSQAITHSPLWRVDVIHPEGYLHRVTVQPDSLIVEVRGSSVSDTTVQLSSPTTDTSYTVGRRRKIRIPLTHGVIDQSLLVLRQGNDHLDFRYLAYPVPGHTPDPTVLWEEPGTGIMLLIAAGEGAQVEFKTHLPEGNDNESRRTMLKTVAAFASGTGGTILFGVNDDGSVTGIDPATIDRQRDRLVNMIRDLVTPGPTYNIRTETIANETILVLEVQPGRGAHALFPNKPEFYVRRGATTFRARVDEVASAFSRS